MQNASILSTDLSKADLRGADLREAELRNTTLYQTNMHGVNLGSTTIAHTDLSSIKGLAEIDHSGPSDTMLHTIQLPQDGSALHFLRGAGIPDEWIDFYRSTMMPPIQYHSCFISYAHQDDDLASRLHSDLQDHGVRCWFAPHDMRIGDKIRSRIDEAIHEMARHVSLQRCAGWPPALRRQGVVPGERGFQFRKRGIGVDAFLADVIGPALDQGFCGLLPLRGLL